MSYVGLGQLGGQWGWFSVWGNPGQSWSSAPRFLGWFYTDYETARFLVRRAHRTLPGWQYGTYGADWLMYTSPSQKTFSPKWQQIFQVEPLAPGGGPCTSKTGCVYNKRGHVSWVYATTKTVADAIRDMVKGAPSLSWGTASVSTEDWVLHTIVGDSMGRAVV